MFLIVSIEVIMASSCQADLQTQLTFLIEKSKGKYYLSITSKLSDIGKGSKTHWFSFPYGQKNLPCIPPLLENNKYIKDFKEKAEILNSFIANLFFLIKQQQSISTIFVQQDN